MGIGVCIIDTNAKFSGSLSSRASTCIERLPFCLSRPSRNHQRAATMPSTTTLKRLPAGRFGVQLPKAMTLRLAATGQIGGDPNHEEEQQYERSYGAPPGGGGRYQGGSKTPSGAAKDAGTPKSTNACFDPTRSASFATPATLKTKTNSKRATSSATYMKRPLSGRLAEPRQAGALLPTTYIQNRDLSCASLRKMRAEPT